LAKAVERPMVGVVGGDTLLGREIRELLGESKQKPRVQLLAATPDGSTILAAEEDEALVMTPMNAESLEGSKAAFLAATPSASRRAAKINPKGGPVLIDLTGALEDQPQARLRAPSAEPPGRPAAPPAPIQVIAHPAAIALTMFLTKLAKVSPMRRSLIHIFEPASERGQRGIEELQQQNRALLAFQKLKTDVFDAQLAFNLLARYGEEALESLELIEQRAERHLASLLAVWPGVPMPSLRVVQAPVFHGHSFSVWAEFENNPDAGAIARALAAQGLDVRPDDPPTNAAIAGQGGISVGAIWADRNHSRACWFWLVADNLRLAAQNAVTVALEVL
jgi:aspartate-semialdehyde dehydrogenase